MSATAIRLSEETRSILAVASTINNSIRIEAGNMVKTIHPSGAIIMEAEVSETFPESFAVYELNRLLSVLKLSNMKDADLIFSGQNFVEIKASKVSVKYKFTDEQFVGHPGRAIVLPSEDLVFNLTGQEINDTLKLASTLGHKFLEFKAQAGAAFMSVTSPDLNDASNDAAIDLDAVPGFQDGSYKVKIDNLILLPGDYKVTICARGITKWEHLTKKVVTYVGLEKV